MDDICRHGVNGNIGNSEWADEEEDQMIAGAGDVQPFTGIGGDDPSSSRDTPLSDKISSSL